MIGYILLYIICAVAFMTIGIVAYTKALDADNIIVTALCIATYILCLIAFGVSIAFFILLLVHAVF